MAVPFAQYPGGMMVHVLWFPTRIQGGVGMPTHGVRIISSTPASNTGGYLHMAVHDVPGMFPSNVFGPHAGGVFVGECQGAFGGALYDGWHGQYRGLCEGAF